jgi:predicted nuclease of predicted toxin-antitoxin system
MSVQLVVDMNLSVEWVAEFAAHGWSAVHWSPVGDPHAEDSAIMAWARANGHVVFTHDLDFATTGPSVLQVRGQNNGSAARTGCIPRRSLLTDRSDTEM